MKPTLLKNLQPVCQILNECGVKYLVIGGAAVALHGHVRFTKDASGQETNIDDLDFWYNSSYGNYYKLLNALEKLGQDVSEFRDEKTPDPRHSYFRLERPEFTLDFLPELPNMPKFSDAFASKETTKLEEVEIPYINYDHLIRNKQAFNRPKDQEDIRQLELKKQSQLQRRGRRQRPG